MDQSFNFIIAISKFRSQFWYFQFKYFDTVITANKSKQLKWRFAWHVETKCKTMMCFVCIVVKCVYQNKKNRRTSNTHYSQFEKIVITFVKCSIWKPRGANSNFSLQIYISVLKSQFQSSNLYYAIAISLLESEFQFWFL